MTIVFGLDGLLLVALWLMFHKAIADYFQNSRLAWGCVWYIICYLVYAIGNGMLNFIANPMLQGGNVLAVPINTPLLIAAQVWGIAWMIGLSVWYLFIVRETRRTILEDEAASPVGVRYDDERAE